MRYIDKFGALYFVDDYFALVGKRDTRYTVWRQRADDEDMDWDISNPLMPSSKNRADVEEALASFAEQQGWKPYHGQ